MLLMLTAPALDAGKYPNLCSYLRYAPQGMDSHPMVQTRSEFSIILRRKLGPLLTNGDLPADILHRLSAAWQPGEWIRETTYVMLSAICRDQLWRTDETFHKGMFDTATEMYQLSLHRHLMRVLSPRLIVMGAAMRWKNFHREASHGDDATWVRIENNQKHSAVFHLGYPTKLFDKLAVQSLAATICAAVGGAGASATRSSISSFGETEAKILLTWQ